MAGRIQRIVMLPRFTSFYGAATFSTVPINVREFAQVILTAWRSTELAAPGLTLSMALEESTDTQVWHSAGSALAPTADQELTGSYSLTMEWVRLSVTVSGGGLGASCWAVGDFVPREGPPAG